KPSALSPSELRRLWRASRTDSSSSTTAMNESGPRSPPFFFVRFPRELCSTGKDVARCAGGNLLYVGISGLLLCGRDAQFIGHADQVRYRLGAHLLHDLTTMHLYGDFADAEFGGDLFVEEARDHQPHHLTLTRSELFMPLAQLGQARPPRARRAVAV